MTGDIVDIEVRYPDRRELAASSSAGRMRPRAQVLFHLDGAVERDAEPRSQWVPPRVARSFEQNLPELPCSYHDASAALDACEQKLCLVALTEMLGRRDYGEREAQRKLQHAGFRPTALAYALERARELRLLDEERFLASYVEERLRRGWGRRKIEADLRQRGSDPYRLPGYPERYFSPEDDLERARAVLSRKAVPQQNAFERLVRHLMGKGFSYSVAAQAVRARLDEVVADDAV